MSGNPQHSEESGINLSTLPEDKPLGNVSLLVSDVQAQNDDLDDFDVSKIDHRQISPLETSGMPDTVRQVSYVSGDGYFIPRGSLERRQSVKLGRGALKTLEGMLNNNNNGNSNPNTGMSGAGTTLMNQTELETTTTRRLSTIQSQTHNNSGEEGSLSSSTQHLVSSFGFDGTPDVMTSPYQRSTLHTSVVPLDLENRRPTRSGSILMSEEERPRLPPALMLDRFETDGNVRMLASPTNSSTKKRVKQHATLRGALFRMPEDTSNNLDSVEDEEEVFRTSYYDYEDEEEEDSDTIQEESDTASMKGKSSAEPSDNEEVTNPTRQGTGVFHTQSPPQQQHRRSSLQMGSDLLGDMYFKAGFSSRSTNNTNTTTPTSIFAAGAPTPMNRSTHNRTKSMYRGKPASLFAPEVPSCLETGENYAPLFSCTTEIPAKVLHVEENGVLQPNSVDSPLFQLDAKQCTTVDNWKTRPFDYLMVLGVPGHNLSQAFCKAKQPEKGMHSYADEILQDPYPTPETDLQRRANESVKIFQEQARKRTPSPVILNCLPQVYKSSEPDSTWAHLAFPTGLTLCATPRPKRAHYPTITMSNGNKLHASVLTFDQRGVWRVRSRNPYYVLTNLRELQFLDYIDGLFSPYGDKRIASAPPVDSLERKLLYEIDQLYTEKSSIMPLPEDLHDPQEFIVGNQASMIMKTSTGESSNSSRVKNAKKTKTGQIQLHHSKTSLCSDTASTQYLVDHHEYKFYLDNHVNCIGFLEPYFNFHFPNASASDARSTVDSLHPGTGGVFGSSDKQGFTLNIQNTGGRMLGGLSDLKACARPDLLVGNDYLKNNAEARRYYGASYDREYGSSIVEEHVEGEKVLVNGVDVKKTTQQLNETLLNAMLGEDTTKQTTKKPTVSIIDTHLQHKDSVSQGNTGSFDATFIEGWEALREHLLGPLYPAVKAYDCQKKRVACDYAVPVMTAGQPNYPSMDYVDHLLYRTLTYYHIVPSMQSPGDPCPSTADAYLAMKEYYTDMLQVHAKLLEECKADGKQTTSDDAFSSIEHVPVLINTANNSSSLETILAINAPKNPLPLLLSPDDLIVYYPKAFMLVSHYPFYTQMEAILDKIQAYLQQESNIPTNMNVNDSQSFNKDKTTLQSFTQWIESIFPTESQVSLSQYLQLLLYRASVPVPGKISVNFSTANPAYSKYRRSSDEIKAMTKSFLTGFISKLPHKYKTNPELFQQHMGATFQEFPKKVTEYLSSLHFQRSLHLLNKSTETGSDTLKTSLSLPAVRHPLSSQFSLVTLFSLVSVDNILRLLTALLTERKIIVFSSNVRNLSIVTHSLLQIFQPLEWWHCFIPVLPISMIKVTQSLQPFILGIPTSLMYLVDPTIVDPAIYNVSTNTVLEYEKKACSASYSLGMAQSNNSEQHVVTYNLDNDNLHCFDMLHHLPAIYAQRLAYGLIEVVEQMKLQNLQVENAQSQATIMHIKQFDASVYSLVWQFYGCMFHGLHKFIKLKGTDTVFNKYLWLHYINQRISYDSHVASIGTLLSWSPSSPSVSGSHTNNNGNVYFGTNSLLQNSSIDGSNANHNEQSDSEDLSPILPSFTTKEAVDKIDTSLSLGASAPLPSVVLPQKQEATSKDKGGFWSRLFKSDKDAPPPTTTSTTNTSTHAASTNNTTTTTTAAATTTTSSNNTNLKSPEVSVKNQLVSPKITNPEDEVHVPSIKVTLDDDSPATNEDRVNVTLDVPRLLKKPAFKKRHASSLPIKLTPSQLEEVHNQYAPDLPKTSETTAYLDHLSISNINSPIARTQHRVLSSTTATPGKAMGTPGKNSAMPGQTVLGPNEAYGGYRTNTDIGNVTLLEPLPFFAALADSTALSVLCSEYRTPSLLSDFVMLGEAWRIDMAVEAELGKVTYPLPDNTVCIIQGETQVNVAPPPPPMVPTRLNLTVEQKSTVRITNPMTGAFVLLNPAPVVLQKLCTHLTKQHSFVEGKKYDFSLLLPDCSLSNVQKISTSMLTHYHGILPFGRPNTNPIIKWSSVAKTIKNSLTNIVPSPSCILQPSKITAANIPNWLQLHACCVVIKATHGAVNYRHLFRVKKNIPTGVALNHRQLSLPQRVEVDVSWYSPDEFVNTIVCKSQTLTAFPANYAERVYHPGSVYGICTDFVFGKSGTTLEMNSGPFLVLGAGVGGVSVIDKMQPGSSTWAEQLGMNAGDKIEVGIRKSPALKFTDVTPISTSMNHNHGNTKLAVTGAIPALPMFTPISTVSETQIANVLDRMDTILNALLSGTKLPVNGLSVLRHIMRDAQYAGIAPYYFHTSSSHTRRVPIGAQFSIDLNATKVNVFHPARSTHQCHQVTHSNIRPNIGHYYNFVPCSSSNRGIKYTSFYNYKEPTQVDSFFPPHAKQLFGAPIRQALLRTLTQPTTRARLGIIDYLHININNASNNTNNNPTDFTLSSNINTSNQEEVGIMSDILDAWGYPITYSRISVQQSCHAYLKPLYTSLFSRDYAQTHWISPAGFMTLVDVMVAALEACLEAEDWSTAIQFYTLCREYCTPRQCCMEIARKDYYNNIQKYKNTFIGTGVYEDTKPIAALSKVNPLVMNYENKYLVEEEHMKKLCQVATPTAGKVRKSNAKTFIDANLGISPIPTIFAYTGSKVTTIPEQYNIYEVIDKTKRSTDTERRTKSQQPQVVSQAHNMSLDNSCFVKLPFADVWTPPSSNYSIKSMSELAVVYNWDDIPQQILVDLPEIRNHPIFLRPELWIVCFFERIQIWKTLNPHAWNTLESIMSLDECVNATNQFNAQIQSHRESYIVARNSVEHHTDLEDAKDSAIDIDIEDVEVLFEIVDTCKPFITPESTFFAKQYADWVRDIINQITMHMGTADCSLAVWYYVTTTVLDSQIACIPIWVRLDLEEVLKTGPEIIKLAHESQTNNI